jgi:DNA-binding CsgD family transcriptional regulator/predicted ATPase
MRDTIAWSYELLGPNEQSLFRQLAVFSGGFSAEAVEAVCRAETPVLDGLALLIDHSIVRETAPTVGPGAAPRFGMLETVREYALELLNASDEADVVHDRHANYVLTLVERISQDQTIVMDKEWYDALDVEHDNLRVALNWLLETRDAERGSRLVGNLWKFWEGRGYLVEGLTRTESFLALGDAAVGADSRVKALRTAGWLATWQGRFDLAIARYEEALELLLGLEDQRNAPIILLTLGIALSHAGEGERSRRMIEQSLRLAPELGDPYSHSMSLLNLALVVESEGDVERALGMLEQALDIARQRSDHPATAQIYRTLALFQRRQGQLPEASNSYRESLTRFWSLGLKPALVDNLAGLALVAQAHRRAERAVVLFAAASAVRWQTSWLTQPILRPEYESAIAALRAGLGDDAFDSIWDRGAAMPLERAIEFALESADSESTTAVPAATIPTSQRHPLSPRELDVLRCLITGQSNAEIASVLFISPNTVSNHVANIMNKLGVDSRTAVATWAVRNGIG